jgi:hypothetical protein
MPGAQKFCLLDLLYDEPSIYRAAFAFERIGDWKAM